MMKKIAFSMYPVIDMNRARKFYENILGIEFHKSSGNERWFEYDLLEGGCFALTTLSQNKPSVNSGGVIAFEVDDLITLIEKLKTNNVEILAENIESPVCRMCIIKDTEGNSIILHKLKEK
ncbi:MAG: VOC family protein [Candidatus Sericytochromatia bacterium]